MSYENQINLKDRIDNQKWEWICDAHFTKFGRGIVSLGKLEKDTIIVDYNGKVITGQKFEEYVQQPDVTSEFVMEVAGRFILRVGLSKDPLSRSFILDPLSKVLSLEL